MKNKKNEFIRKAISVHGNKYDYSNVEYERSSKKVCIICPEHGEFWQSPDTHLRGHGCPKCGKEKSIRSRTQDYKTILKKFKNIHGDLYDYSCAEKYYKKYDIKIPIICHKIDECGKEHGIFYQTPISHLQGHGCPKCGEKNRIEKTKKTNEDFLKKALAIHGDKYIYEHTVYEGVMNNIVVTCRKHGDFTTTPNRFLNGHGCPKCQGLNKTTEEWIEDARKVHGNKYDYSKTNYTNSSSKVIIICPVHGEFLQSATNHLQGSGCPSCNDSSLEREIKIFLTDNNISFISRKKFTWLGKQHLDFYLPDYNIAIECQGLQHFKPSAYFGGEERFKKQKELDEIKKELCEKNNIKLIYYTHYDYKDEPIIFKEKEELLNQLKNEENANVSPHSDTPHPLHEPR